MAKKEQMELFPEETTTFTFKMKVGLKADSEKMAESKGLSLAAYIRYLLIEDKKRESKRNG